ncbi:MAG: hypothetical protein INR73_17130 [Williamsia sp.]|nr:hypothetical protein [Williamsia sp.]
MNKPLSEYSMHFLNAFLLLFLVSDAWSQSIQLQTGQTNFNFNTSSTLENAQVSVNAFSLSVYSFSNFSVYAKVSSVSSSSGVTMPASMVAIKLNTVSPSRSANFNPITLSTNNQQIIQSYYTLFWYVTYTYNLIIGPIGYDYPPGNQIFNILFTITSP